MDMPRTGWQGLPAVQSTDQANYSLLTAMKYNIERIIALLDVSGLSGTSTGSAFSQMLSEINSEMDELEAAIRSEQTARIDGDEALAQQISTIIATGDGSNHTYLLSEPPGPPTYTLVLGDLWFDSNDNFKLYRWSGTAWEAVDDQRIVANTAAITAEQTARINADEALASDITALTTVVNTGDATLQASIASEATARANADSALGVRIDSLTATMTNADGVITARIAAEESARASADSAATSRMDTMTASINYNAGAISTVAANLVTEQTARADADAALTGQITTMDARVTNNATDIATTNANLTNEGVVRANADSALGTQITNLSATVNGQGTSITQLTARVATEETARADGDEALATRVDTVEAVNIDQQTQITTADARITTETTARANADNQLAQNITNVSTTVNGHTASISTMQQSINGIQAEYTLTVNASGQITGFELISGIGKSAFIVKADQFKIDNATGTPFEVLGGIVYIKNAVIQEASIGTIKLQENATFDFDYNYFDYGGIELVRPQFQWHPVGPPNYPEQRITLIAASGTTQVANISASLILKGSGSNPDKIYYRCVRLNDGKVLQTHGPISVHDARQLVYSFEYYDEAPIANTPCTYEVQYQRVDGGSSNFFTVSIKGVVYKR